MNTRNGSNRKSLSLRGSFEGSGMGPCCKCTAGFWHEKLLPQDTKRKQHQMNVPILFIYYFLFYSTINIVLLLLFFYIYYFIFYLLFFTA